MDTVGKRIKGARLARKLTQKRVAEMLHTDPSSISRWENDEQGITLKNAEALSAALGVTVAHLLGSENGTVAPMGTASPTKAYPIAGEIQAGVWREGSEFDDNDRDYANFSVPPQYRDLVMNAYIVRGNSMNMVYPNGTLVLVASTIANGITPKDGQRVLVDRRDKDGKHEATLKKYKLDADGKAWLWPESTSPEHQAPIAYVDDDTDEVTITGIVAVAQTYGNLF